MDSQASQDSVYPAVPPPSDCLQRDTIFHGLDPNSTPDEIFRHFLDDNMIEDIVTESDRYTSQVHANTPTAFKNWKRFSIGEFLRFLALNLLMGLVQKPSIKEYWSTDALITTPTFGKTMSRNRFEEILRSLHFIDNSTNPPLQEDRFLKLGKFFPTLLKKFQDAVTPGEYLCIDETLLLFKGQLAFKQYIPLKRARFGIKFFALVDCSTKFIIGYLPYQGKLTKLSEDAIAAQCGFGGSSVITLLNGYLNCFRKVVIDNYFMSKTLALKLRDWGTYCLGTNRKNRARIPDPKKKLRPGEIIVHVMDNLLIERWQDRREVLMLNSFMEHRMCDVLTRNPQNARQKPESVLIYNQKMGGMDDIDQQSQPYVVNRKCIKWYKKTFFHLIDRAVHNSYAVWNTFNPEAKTTYLTFLKVLIRNLIDKNPHVRVPRGRPVNLPIHTSQNIRDHSKWHYPVKDVNSLGQPIRADCFFCSSKNLRKATPYKCTGCEKKFCIDGARSCFYEYHRNLIREPLLESQNMNTQGSSVFSA